MIDFQHVAFTLCGLIFAWIIGEIKELKRVQNLHNLDIQKLKDFNEHKVERIERDIEELRKDFLEFKKVIEDKIHRDSNIINQQKALIERLSRYLDEKELKKV